MAAFLIGAALTASFFSATSCSCSELRSSFISTSAAFSPDALARPSYTGA
ncbi:MAG: hypothetical protein QM765_22700 [Myxococcales bacterium]